MRLQRAAGTTRVLAWANAAGAPVAPGSVADAALCVLRQRTFLLALSRRGRGHNGLPELPRQMVREIILRCC